MLLKPYDPGCLAHASHLIVNIVTGTTIAVDPQRDIDQYLQDVTQHSCHIKYIFLTHLHTDFLAGHMALRDRLDATICLGAQAQAECAFTPLAEVCA